MTETLRANLLSPIVLAFALGVCARLAKSDLRLPKDLYTALSVYLIFAIGLKGGVELSHASWHAFAAPALATLALGCITPVTAFVVLRHLGRFDAADAAGIAAHYGSVSAVTFIAAQAFVASVGAPAEGFLPTLLTLLEAPGIAVALLLGTLTAAEPRPIRTALHEITTSRPMVLLVGGLAIGWLMAEPGWQAVAPFFEGGFKGALMLFLLEMGLVAADRLGDLRKVGRFLLGFGIVVPIAHGALGAALGTAVGLSLGGATVLATMAASASYIAAPPAVRMSLPTANPTYYLTAALAITFPFNVTLGIPMYFTIARWLQGVP